MPNIAASAKLKIFLKILFDILLTSIIKNHVLLF